MNEQKCGRKKYGKINDETNYMVGKPLVPGRTFAQKSSGKWTSHKHTHSGTVRENILQDNARLEHIKHSDCHLKDFNALKN